MATVEPFTVPFTVLIDSQEKDPFAFTALKGDSKEKFRPLFVPTKYQCLGRHPNSKGDYSLEGFEEQIGYERKSMEDIQGTVLGWPSKYDQANQLTSRQDRFRKELENLAKLDFGAVFIEATFEECLQYMPAHGVKTIAENQKSFARIVDGMAFDYRVPWFWCWSRRACECRMYRMLARAYRKLT